MAGPLYDNLPRLWGLLIVFAFAVQDIMLCYWFANGQLREYVEMLLPTLGVAMIVQAIGMLVLLASAIWSGKLWKIAFVWWQIVYVVLCATYAILFAPSMAGLGIGAFSSACLVCNIWTALHCRVKAETIKEVAATAHTSAEVASKRKTDDRVDAFERVYWPLDDASSPTAVAIASWRGRCAAFSMLFNFSAGTLGFVFAYLKGTLKTTLSTFGLGFLGMIIAALLLLDLARTLEACRLADHFKSVNVFSITFFLYFAIGDWARTGAYNFDSMCFVHWAACVYSEIAEILVQSSLDQNIDDEEYHSESFEEDWVQVD